MRVPGPSGGDRGEWFLRGVIATRLYRDEPHLPLVRKRVEIVARTLERVEPVVLDEERILGPTWRQIRVHNGVSEADAWRLAVQHPEGKGTSPRCPPAGRCAGRGRACGPGHGIGRTARSHRSGPRPRGPDPRGPEARRSRGASPLDGPGQRRHSRGPTALRRHDARPPFADRSARAGGAHVGRGRSPRCPARRRFVCCRTPGSDIRSTPRFSARRRRPPSPTRRL